MTHTLKPILAAAFALAALFAPTFSRHAAASTPTHPTPQPAAAQPPHAPSTDLDDRLDAAARFYKNLGLLNPAARETFSRFYGSLAHNQSEFVYVTLRAGVSYTIIAVADGDCRDLDIELYDENDNLIDADFAHDSAPIVSVTPIRSATFRYRVSMVNCDFSPCFYVSGVWQR